MKWVVRYQAIGDTEIMEQPCSSKEDAECFAENLICESGWIMPPTVRASEETQLGEAL